MVSYETLSKNIWTGFACMVLYRTYLNKEPKRFRRQGFAQLHVRILQN